ncbi:MAG TPA: GNAT family N-acetyltransferase [Solirubrobacterales bacterium]|nr:GNAT family N-acetyltransferase [Solirubrobacterales bacterium]
MLGYPPDTVWVRYDWRSEDLPREPPPIAVKVMIRPALPDEAEALAELVVLAYASDPAWAEMMEGIEMRMRSRVLKTCGRPGSAYVVVADMAGVPVGCSGVATEHETGQNLLTGICVLPTHQRRGLGRRLLWESLCALRDLGVTRPRVYTEEGALADRHVYPSFGSERTAGVAYPP